MENRQVMMDLLEEDLARWSQEGPILVANTQVASQDNEVPSAMLIKNGTLADDYLSFECSLPDDLMFYEEMDGKNSTQKYTDHQQDYYSQSSVLLSPESIPPASPASSFDDKMESMSLSPVISQVQPAQPSYQDDLNNVLQASTDIDLPDLNDTVGMAYLDAIFDSFEMPSTQEAQAALNTLSSMFSQGAPAAVNVPSQSYPVQEAATSSALAAQADFNEVLSASPVPEEIPKVMENTRKRSSSSSSSDESDELWLPGPSKPKKRGRKCVAQTIEKKERKRGQNKTAANKYRQKKKVEQEMLGGLVAEQEVINNTLRDQMNKLLGEIKIILPLAEAVYGRHPSLNNRVKQSRAIFDECNASFTSN